MVDSVHIDGAIVPIPKGWRQVVSGKVRKTDRFLHRNLREFPVIHPSHVGKPIPCYLRVIRRKAGHA